VGKGWLLRDITRDQEVDRFKSALLAAVGHEVRTPLAAIKGNASSILMDDVIWPAADLKHFAQTIDREADRLARTINHLLDLSRSEAGVLRLNREPLQLPVLARSALARAEAVPLDFRVDIPADLPPLLADADRIEIVLANLISNAAAYGNGVASLKAYTRAGEIVIDISDNGPGIASEELPYVFDRFYRAAAGVKRRAGGSGLGLAICRAFVEAHHGRIWVSSDQSGTTFSLSLPFAATAATQDTRAETGRP
jgi:signal transduction histidine kinase